MKVFTASQIREVERKAVQYGLDELRLMENAGSACARLLRTELKLENNTSKKVVILCGKGKNGGDGFVIARKLTEIGMSPTIVLIDGMPTIAEPCEMFERAKTVNVRHLNYASDSMRVLSEIKCADLVIDCIFGIGFHGTADEKYKNIFCAVNNSSALVCSIDIPSGIDCAGTDFDEQHIKADMTVAISVYKEAFINSELSNSFGKIYTVKIGIPDTFFNEVKTQYEVLDREAINAILPERKPDSHKGTFGHALNICGSKRMPGACVMSALGALHSGVGKLTLAFPEQAYTPVTAHLMQPLFLPVYGDENGYFSAMAIPDIIEALNGKNAVLIGCGIGTDKGAQSVLKEVVRTCKSPLVIDADGINILSQHINLIKEREYPTVITPHIGEMARLTGLDAQYIIENKLSVCENFAKEYGVTVVLKSHRTVISDGKHTFLNIKGNAGMAQAGSGDILAGIIVSFIAQGMSPADSAKAGVFVHALAGDICEEKFSQRSMTPADMAKELSCAFKSL